MKKTKIKYYRSIEELPIYNYFKCLEGDLRYIYKCDIDDAPIISNESIEAWEVIEDEWSIEMDDYSSREMRMKFFSIIKMQKQLLFLEGCIILLAVKYDNDVVSELKRKRYRYNEEDKIGSLKQLNGEYLNLKRSIQEKLNELTENSKNSVDKYELISSIERMRSTQIDLHKTSTALFIAYLKEAKREYKASQSKK